MAYMTGGTNNLSNCSEQLDNLVQKIYKWVSNLFGSTQEQHITENISSTADASIQVELQEIKDYFEEISEMLREVMLIKPEYEDEYFFYDSVKDMALYILDDVNLLHQHKDFITDIVLLFRERIRFKEELSSKDYARKVEEFDLKLMDYEQFFYTKICTPSENYDEEVLSKITNALLDL